MFLLILELPPTDSLIILLLCCRIVLIVANIDAIFDVPTFIDMEFCNILRMCAC